VLVSCYYDTQLYSSWSLNRKVWDRCLVGKGQHLEAEFTRPQRIFLFYTPLLPLAPSPFLATSFSPLTSLTPRSSYDKHQPQIVTYDHTHWKARDPVRSPIDKPVRARLVVGSVTTSESLVLYVIFFGLLFCIIIAMLSAALSPVPKPAQGGYLSMSFFQVSQSKPSKRQPYRGNAHMPINENCTSPPLLAPPRQVALRLPVGQTALAARTHCSHLFFVRLIVLPAPTALSVNSALPTRPWVMLGPP
jgi:hypothetical protein